MKRLLLLMLFAVPTTAMESIESKTIKAYIHPITIQTHIEKNPQITQPKNIDVLLGWVHNKTNSKIQVGIRPSEDLNIIATIPQNESRSLNVPLPITRPNLLLPLPDPIGSINDGLQPIYFTGDRITKRPAYLNVLINKTTNTLRSSFCPDNRDMPCTRNDLELNNTKSFYISVTLEGDNFEKSQIKITNEIDTSIKKEKGRMNDLGE